MKPIIPAIALSAILTGCIQSAPVKPEVVAPVKADRIVSSCLTHKRFVIKYYDTKGDLEYVTFMCQPIFSSKQPPKPPNIEQDNYKGPNALELAPTQ